MSVDYHIVGDGNELAACAAELFTTVTQKAVADRGACMLALSGGKTPKLLFEKLGQPQFKSLPWQRISLFWGDERFVPEWHADSNYRMTREALLERLSVKPAAICPVNTSLPSAEAAAESYAATICEIFPDSAIENGWPIFDCILLGLGTDGHTASLFPGDLTISEKISWTAVGRAPDNSQRITLTLPVLNAARQVIFLVSGSEKAAVVAAIARGQAKKLPAAMVKTKKVTWLLDAAAASTLVSR
ncbi:MAG: pgl [Anaerosporomusa subterranea]|nr:pgl [Anaerosporomusa subterranea]